MEVLQTSALPLGDGAAQKGLWRSGEHRIVPDAWGPIKNPRDLGRDGVRPLRGDQSRPCWDEAGRNFVAESAGASGASGEAPAEWKAARRGAGGPADSSLERETGFEPATSTLARSHSTTELFPLGDRTSAPNTPLHSC